MLTKKNYHFCISIQKLTKRLAIAYLSDLEEKKLERSQVLPFVYSTAKERFQTLATKAVQLQRRVSIPLFSIRRQNGLLLRFSTAQTIKPRHQRAS